MFNVDENIEYNQKYVKILNFFLKIRYIWHDLKLIFQYAGKPAAKAAEAEDQVAGQSEDEHASARHLGGAARQPRQGGGEDSGQGGGRGWHQGGEAAAAVWNMMN